MTRWYAYKWLCDACGGIHYYDATSQGCGRCGKFKFTRHINNAYAAARLEKQEPAKVSPVPAGKSKIVKAAPPPAIAEPTDQTETKPSAAENVAALLASYDQIMNAPVKPVKKRKRNAGN